MVPFFQDTEVKHLIEDVSFVWRVLQGSDIYSKGKISN